jgi:hypothetical protein
MKKRGLADVASILLITLGLAFTPSLAKASAIILDGDFLDPIGMATTYSLVRLDECRDHNAPSPDGYCGQLRKHAGRS